MRRDIFSESEQTSDPLLLSDEVAPPELVGAQVLGLFYGSSDPAPTAGERALMRAVLRDAIVCLAGQADPARERRRLAAEARQWVQSRSRKWVFSFEGICDILGIDSSYARRQLLRLASRTFSGDKSGHRRSSMPNPTVLEERVAVIRRSRPKVRSGTARLSPRQRMRERAPLGRAYCAISASCD